MAKKQNDKDFMTSQHFLGDLLKKVTSITIKTENLKLNLIPKTFILRECLKMFAWL